MSIASKDPDHFPHEDFADVIAANAMYVASFEDAHLNARAAKGLAIVTCMDSRISPLDILGLQPGDVKILRNAGARVTDDVQRTLLLATYLLGVERILIMPHTDCRMVGSSEADIHVTIREATGTDTRSIEFRTSDFASGPAPSAEQLAAFYAANRARYTVPEQRQIRYAVIDKASGTMIGSSQYKPEADGTVEIGWTFLAPSHWGGSFNREMKRLMLAHALQFVERVEFRVGECNLRSQRAMTKIGGQLTERFDMVETPSGPMRHVIFEITRASFAGGPLNP